MVTLDVALRFVFELELGAPPPQANKADKVARQRENRRQRPIKNSKGSIRSRGEVARWRAMLRNPTNR
jgi:hypothetical protein